MPTKYDELMALKNLGQKYAYSDREVLLYAYGRGRRLAGDRARVRGGHRLSRDRG